MQQILILGAGISGIMAGRALQTQGYQVALLDKARGPGGRLASKRLPDWQFDMGAQYITARSRIMQNLLQEWETQGLVVPWRGDFAFWQGNTLHPHQGASRYVGTPRMSALSRGLSEDLTLFCGQAVTQLRYQQRQWQLTLADGTQHSAETLFSTIPLPQLHTLLSAEPSLAHVRAQLPVSTYQPCWALGYRLHSPWPSAYASITFKDHPLLDFVCLESSKPGRDTTHTLSVQCNAAFSAEHLDIHPDELSQQVLHSLQDLLGEPLLVQDYYAHRWLYAKAQPATVTPDNPACLWLPELQLGIGGDIFSAGKVEGAVCSGLALAAAVKNCTDE